MGMMGWGSVPLMLGAFPPLIAILMILKVSVSNLRTKVPKSSHETISRTSSGSVKKEPDQLNNLNELATYFPLVTQKLLLFLPAADLKSIRQCTKSLKHAVDQYVGLNFCLSEYNPGYSPSQNVKIFTSDMKDSFKTLGIRSLTARDICRTNISDLFTFPYLLRRLHIVGFFKTETLLTILTECWNLQELKFDEGCTTGFSNKDDLFDAFKDYMHGSIRLDSLKTLHIRWKGVSTMGCLLALLSVIDARNLQKFYLSFVPIAGMYHALVIGTVAHFMDTVAKTVKDFSFVVEHGSSGDYFFESARQFQDLESFADLLPTFHELVTKHYFGGNEYGQSLPDLLRSLGKKTKLTSLHLDIQFLEEFGENWFYFTIHQNSLQRLFIKSWWSWPLIQKGVKANAKELRCLALVLPLTDTTNMEDVLGSCPQLKYLHLKNSFRNQILINAKFDEILPNLEGLFLCNVLIRCVDMARVNNLEHLKCFMHSVGDEINPARRGAAPDEMFGVTFEDFKIMLSKRNLDHLVLSNQTIIRHGPNYNMETDENLLDEPIFHGFVPGVENHIAMADGEPNNSSAGWFFQLLEGEWQRADTIYLTVVKRPVRGASQTFCQCFSHVME